MGLRFVFKLILNSLYGRWGLRNINYEYKIVDNKNIDEILLTQKAEVLYKSEKISFIKSQGPNDKELINFLNKEKMIGPIENNSSFNEPKSWGSNISAVQFSACITAYSRIYINQFKNMKDNIYFGGDADSIILEKPLDPNTIGNNLGQLKLEYIIKEGFYHSKKFYLCVTDQHEIIIKADGIKNKDLKLGYVIL